MSWNMLRRRAVGNLLGQLVPARLLLGAEVGAVEQLLQAEDLDALLAGVLDERQVLVDHPLLDVVGGSLERDVRLDLDQAAADDSRHGRKVPQSRTGRSGSMSGASAASGDDCHEDDARDAVYRHRVREPVPARVGAADRVGFEHHARLRGGLGRRGREDHRHAPGRSTSRARRPSSCGRRPTATAMSMEKRPNSALHSSWNWELISDKPLDWWLPRLRRIKDAFPHKVLVASIMAGSEDDKEVNHWRELAVACQEQGVDAFELNLSCPHMDRVDMGSNIGKNVQLIDTVVRAVKEVARKPVWVKLTPTTTNIAKEAEAAFNGGRRRDLLVQHVHVAAADRSRVARVRVQRRRQGVVRRPRRTGDPAAVAGQDGADDDGVPGAELFGDRRDLGFLAGAELLPARLRHGAGLHRGDARSRDRART